MRRLWVSLLLVPVMVAAVASAAWASPAAPAARRPRPGRRPQPRTAAAPAPAARALQPGMKGAKVKALQRRLAALKYYPGAIDGKFGTSTLEAVWAFYEVQGLTPHNYVSSAMKRALAHPRAPKVLVKHGGANRIEISLYREVLVLYRNNKVQLISHVSSGGHYYFCNPGGGCGYAVTPTGNFRTGCSCAAGCTCRWARCTTRCSSSAPRTRSTATPTCRWRRSRTAASGSRWTSRPSSTSW